MFKSRRMGWTGHVARIGARRHAYRVLVESQKERDYYEDLDVVGRIILKWILERWNGVVWTVKPITVAARSKARTSFARSNAGIVGSNPTQCMDVCVRLFCVYVVLCVGSGLATV
jgi:hypothetical protein